MNNVFKLYFRPSYYLKHHIKFFKEIAANLKILKEFREKFFSAFDAYWD